jgi:glycosyltransferase involved in cell wall biosynthesis
MSISVSTVTPVYCGEEYLADLVNELAFLRDKWVQEKAPFSLVESIFIVDGAVDNSEDILFGLKNHYSWVKVISLSRNFGQHSATVAGICHTSSDWVVTLDEDLQHKPGEIETLFKTQALAGADLVYAQPLAAVHGSSWRDLSSRVIKNILAKITATPQMKLFNSFRLIRGSIGRAAASSSSSQTYLDIALSWFTKSCAGAMINMQDDRFVQTQSSGYGLLKLIGHARKLIVSAQVDIASSGLVVGIITIILAIVIGSAVVFQKLFFPESVESAGWASTIALDTFFGGVIITLLCIALEYINVVLINQLGKPTFFTVDRTEDSVIAHWYQKKSDDEP